MKTCRGYWGVVALTTLSLLCRHSSSADPPKLAGLSQSQLTTLTELVIPAWQQGSPLAVLQSLSPIVSKLDDTRTELLDKYLAEQGIPASEQLLADARLSLVEQNLSAKLPKPEPRELLLTLKGLIGKIETVLSEAGVDPALATGHLSRKSLEDYEELFWELHVLDNRLLSAARIATDASSLSAAANRLSKKNFSESQQQVLATDIGLLERRVREMRQTLASRDFYNRVARLEFANQILTQSHDLKKKFLAAHVLDLDGERLSRQLEIPDLLATSEPQNSVSHPEDSAQTAASEELDPLAGMFELKKKQLAEQVSKSITSARQAAGEDLLTKSRLLFTGLHWWYRGRYGAGSDGHGLLKNQLALVSPQAMFGLYMPMHTAKPSDPMSSSTQSSSTQIPQVDRRHHYLWQFETRSIQTTIKSSSNRSSATDYSKTQITTFDRFY